VAYKKKCADCRKPIGKDPFDHMKTGTTKIMGGGRNKKRIKVDVCRDCLMKDYPKDVPPSNNPSEDS
jgi:hypothetical protein